VADESKAEGSERGSGITTRAIVTELQKLSAEEYVRTLEGFQQPKKKIADMNAAFKDGMRTMLMHLERMGVIKIVREK